MFYLKLNLHLMFIYNFSLLALHGGNQRELARQKNLKKQQEGQKGKGATDKDGNKGVSLESRKHRDAEVMREKQKKAEEKQKDGPGTSKQ